MSDHDAPGTALELRSEAQGSLATPLPPMSDTEVAALWRQAKALAESGLFKDARQAGQAFAKILAGRDLGLTPFESMGQLHVIEGKVEASSDLHATRIRERDGYDFRVAWVKDDGGSREAVWASEDDPTDPRPTVGCAISFSVNGEQRGVSVFTVEDAQAAGLVKDRGAWTKFPRNMLFARAMTNGVAWYVPEVMGGMRVYAPNEIPRDHDLTTGDGRPPVGEDPTDDLPTEVEAVIARARALGHVGLQDRSTALMAVQGGRETLGRWLKGATANLNRMARERGEVVDAVAVEEPHPDATPQPPPAQQPVEADTGPSAEPQASEGDPVPEPQNASETPESADEAPPSASSEDREKLTEALADAETAAEDAKRAGDDARAAFFAGEAASIRERLAGLDPGQGSLI
jgi:hypothetical protein